MGPTGIFTQRWLVCVARIGSALFHQRPSTEARISALSPHLPFAATPPGTGESGAGLFLTELPITNMDYV
jgi:hypothetical protein